MGKSEGQMPAPEAVPDEPGARIQAYQLRMRRQLYLVLGLLSLGLFAFVDYQYETVRGASGAAYRVWDAGRYVGTDGRRSYFKYFTRAHDPAGRERELGDLVALATQFADRNGDPQLEVVSVDRRFRYGLFHVDVGYHVRYHRDGAGWVRD